MKRTTEFSSAFLALTLTAVTIAFSGCSSQPPDSQITANVQKQIGADSALQGQPISVAAHDGTVTLSGNVNGPGSRELASNDASKVEGVKKVVNDLMVGNSTSPAPTDNGSSAMNNQPGEANAPNMPPSPPPPSNATPAAPASLVIPAGTRIRVRLRETLSSKRSQTGEPFSGTLATPIRVNGTTVVRAGAEARGTVTDAKNQGRFKGQGVLALRLESLRADGRTYPVQTSRIERVEQGKGKRSAVMTGGGAGLGAIIGGVAGGGKGALIGGLLGGGGGAAGSAYTGNKDIVLPAESVLTFDLERSVTVRR